MSKTEIKTEIKTKAGTKTETDNIWKTGDRVYIYKILTSRYLQFIKTSWYDSRGSERFDLELFNQIGLAIGKNNIVDRTGSAGTTAKSPFGGCQIMTTVEISDQVAKQVVNYKDKSNLLYLLVDFKKTEQRVGDLLAAKLDDCDMVYHDKVEIVLDRVFRAEELYFMCSERYIDTGCCGPTVSPPTYYTCLVGVYKGKIMGEVGDRVDLYHANWWKKSDAIRASVVPKLGVTPLSTLDLVHESDLSTDPSSTPEYKFNWCLGFGWDRDISDNNRFTENPFKKLAPRWHQSKQEAIFKRVIEMDAKTDKVGIDGYFSREKEPITVWRMIYSTIGKLPVPVSSDSDTCKLVQDWADRVNTLIDLCDKRECSKQDLARLYQTSIENLCTDLEKLGSSTRSKFISGEHDAILPWKLALFRRLRKFRDCQSGLNSITF